MFFNKRKSSKKKSTNIKQNQFENNKETIDEIAEAVNPRSTGHWTNNAFCSDALKEVESLAKQDRRNQFEQGM